MPTLFAAVALLLIASAICSGSEAALFSLPLLKARQLAESGKRGARTLLKIKEDMARPISTLVVLNNLANIVGSITVGGIAALVLGNQWLALFSAVLTFLVIIFAEIIPKTLGERYCEQVSLLIARPVALLTTLLRPVHSFIELITSPITKQKPSAKEPTTNENEIKFLAQIGGEEGAIRSEESKLIQRAFEFDDLTAVRLMTPRTAMTTLAEDTPIHLSRQAVLDSQHSRIVTTGANIDDVTGIVFKTELLAAMIDGDDPRPISALARPVEFIAESTPAADLLKLFRNSRQHLAVVLDEFGGVRGVVTLEDVLEILTGEIVDETDRDIDLQATAREQNQRLAEV